MTRARLALVGGLSLVVAAGVLAYALTRPRETHRAKLVRMRAVHMAASLDAGVFDSGPDHVTFYGCSSGACLAALNQLAGDTNVDQGWAVELEDGGFASIHPSYIFATPQQYDPKTGAPIPRSQVPNLAPDGGLVNPLLYTAPEQHPLVPTIYRLAVFDRDHALVTATAASDPVVSAVALSPPGPPDPVWMAQLLADGGILLEDGAVTSVTALEGDAAPADSGSQTLDAGVGIDSGGLGLDAGGLHLDGGQSIPKL